MANTEQLISRLLEIMRNDIAPLTAEGVKAGNKLFGAAIARKSDLSLVLAASNAEQINPLYHGEIACLNDYWALPATQRPPARECYFLSTHEPCSLCLSALTWSGFDNFYYFFSYEDSRDDFAIPHDLNILQQVFACNDGAYQAVNSYWSSYALQDLINSSSSTKRAQWLDQVAAIKALYQDFSQIYQQNKAKSNFIPLA